MMAPKENCGRWKPTTLPAPPNRQLARSVTGGRPNQLAASTADQSTRIFSVTVPSAAALRIGPNARSKTQLRM